MSAAADIRYLSQVMTGRPAVFLLNKLFTGRTAHRKYHRKVYEIEQLEPTQVCKYPVSHFPAWEHNPNHWIIARGVVKLNGRERRVMLEALPPAPERDRHWWCPISWVEEIHDPETCHAFEVAYALQRDDE